MIEVLKKLEELEIKISKIEKHGFIFNYYLGKNINHYIFLQEKRGLYFYTTKQDIESLCKLENSKKTILVCTKDLELFQIN